jgi:hypothetical protein
LLLRLPSRLLLLFLFQLDQLLQRISSLCAAREYSIFILVSFYGMIDD